ARNRPASEANLPRAGTAVRSPAPRRAVAGLRALGGDAPFGRRSLPRRTCRLRAPERRAPPLPPPVPSLLALAAFAPQSVVPPASPGRDMSRYIQAFVQLFYDDPVLPS